MTNFPSGGTPTHFDCRSVRIYMEEETSMLNFANGEENVKLASGAAMGSYKLMGKGGKVETAVRTQNRRCRHRGNQHSQ